MPKEPEKTEFPEHDPVYKPVIVVEHRGPSVLVEYENNGRRFRTIIPQEELVDGQADEYTLSALGIPYGFPWENIITLSATPQALADELRKNGIWTVQDLDRNPQAVFGAIQAVYGVDFGRLIQAAHKGG